MRGGDEKGPTGPGGHHALAGGRPRGPPPRHRPAWPVPGCDAGAYRPVCSGPVLGQLGASDPATRTERVLTCYHSRRDVHGPTVKALDAEPARKRTRPAPCALAGEINAPERRVQESLPAPPTSPPPRGIFAGRPVGLVMNAAASSIRNFGRAGTQLCCTNQAVSAVVPKFFSAVSPALCDHP